MHLSLVLFPSMIKIVFILIQSKFDAQQNIRFLCFRLRIPFFAPEMMDSERIKKSSFCLQVVVRRKRLGDGQRETEDAAPTHLAFNPNFTVMSFDDVFRNA